MSYAIYDTHNGDSQWNHRSGQRVEILRELTEEEADIFDVGRMFHIRFEDGTETSAFEDELTIEEPAAEPGMQYGPFTKVLDSTRKPGGERFIRYDGPNYTILLAVSSAWIQMQILKRNGSPPFLPEIFVREDVKYQPKSLKIETSSYGVLSMDEIRDFHNQVGVAIETANIIQREFVDPIQAGTFVFGEPLQGPENL